MSQGVLHGLQASYLYGSWLTVGERCSCGHLESCWHWAVPVTQDFLGQKAVEYYSISYGLPSYYDAIALSVIGTQGRAYHPHFAEGETEA